jgi:hypothetical protein
MSKFQKSGMAKSTDGKIAINVNSLERYLEE